MEVSKTVELLNALAQQEAAIRGYSMAEALAITCDTHTAQFGLTLLEQSAGYRMYQAPNGDTVSCYFDTPNNAIWLEDGEYGFEHTYCAELA